MTSISFYQASTIITGSQYGSVYLNTLDNDPELLTTLKFNQSNVQDEHIPVVKVLATDYGIGMALDLKGNLRLYDLIRYRKIAKGKDRKAKDEIAERVRESDLSKAFRVWPRV